MVLGNAGDVVNAGAGWESSGVPDTAGFVTYTQGLATLLVDFDITRNITA